MLKLVNIKKQYITGDMKVDALKGIDLEFRESEFVSVLGQSGCGKTTLLNIIGGLDKYTSGDLIINGKSTKKFNDGDWDTYRNHSIGFVFQSYNLIPHQTVLSNVELALTLSGVSPEERKKRATEVLEKVGLGDQLYKKPNQMSGGQMQRVAIARALVNDPDIILADEPTGALDSDTSVSVMEILKQISKEKLIIMVTHNPELAEKYSTRVINLLDGKVISDSQPVTDGKSEEQTEKKAKSKKKSMSFLTALLLSLNNLMTKKGRTFLTSFAGSIGIIGIALILSVSSGVNSYINSVEESTMASYPLTINESSMDTSSMISLFMKQNDSTEEHEDGKIYSNDVMTNMMNSMISGMTTNNLTKLKQYIESDECKIKDYAKDIKYAYAVNMFTYAISNDSYGNTVYKKNPSSFAELMSEIGAGGPLALGDGSSYGMSSGAWTELIGDDEHIKSQYTVVDGRFPSSSDEVVLIVDDNNQVSDFILYILGLRDTNELKEYIASSAEALQNGTECTYQIPTKNFTFEEIYAHRFKAIIDSDKYKLTTTPNLSGGTDTLIAEKSEDELNQTLKDAKEIKIVGIIKAKDSSVSGATAGTLGYTSELMPELIKKGNESDVVRAQLENSETDLFTGQKFGTAGYTEEDVPSIREKMLAIKNNPYITNNPLANVDVENMTDEEIIAYANEKMASSATYQSNLRKLGYVNPDKPSSILIYPNDFKSKDEINNILSDYNRNQEDEKDKITYTDTVALLMNSVTTIINAITYVLIAFVAISLVVSSIMIGIITYISVLERTKEIGILRAIGASKKDISRVFNAETLIIGFGAGVIGIGVTLLLNLLVNLILHSLTGIPTLNAVLPPLGAVILIIISMALTLLAGLIPSGVAAKKDPVIALRTE